MIKNSINIEGITNKEYIESISTRECRICDYSYEIVINNTKGIKNIYQVSIESIIKEKNIIKLKDGEFIVINGAITYKILYVENTNLDNVGYLEATSFFSFSFQNIYVDISNIEIHAIDATFELTDNNINCLITFLFKFKVKDIGFNNIESEIKTKGNAINMTREFY